MSYRSISMAIAMAATLVTPDVRAASKSYKRPATVPAVRVLSTTGPSALMAVPTESEIAKATKEVRDTLHDDYNVTTAAQRRESARDLLRQGIDTRDSAADRYVLLSDAAEMAAGAGDAATASRAVDELARTFQVDPVEMKVARLGEAARSAFTNEAIDGLVSCGLSAEEGALIDERYDAAERLVAIAELAADRGRRVDLKATVAERKKELAALRAGAADYAKARDALAKAPGDPAASVVAGRFLCLVKGDWEKGLPLLAAGNDDALRGLAVKDMENPADPGGRAQVGGGWWDLAGKLSGVMKAQARRRALFWYRQATPALTGVNRKAMDDHVREAQADRLRELNLAPGLVAELFDGEKCEHKRLTRVDSNVDVDWHEGPPAEGVLKDHFSVVWSGYLVVSRAGLYTLAVVANDGATLTVDGAVLLTNGDLAHKRTGVRVPVRLDEGFHPLKLHVWDRTGVANAHLLWSPPGGGGGGVTGGASEVPVPADAFCHEAGELAQVGSIRR